MNQLKNRNTSVGSRILRGLKIGGLIFVVTIIGMSSCSYVSVNGDEEAVLIMKPFFFGHGGVDETPVSSGRIMVAATTDDVIFKITPVAYAEKFENLISDDNVPLDFETHLTLRIHKGSTPDLYKNFGADWYEHNVSPKFRSLVRDVVSAYKMQDLISSREILTAIDEKLFKSMETYFKAIKIPVEIMQVTIGAATPPDEVLVETQKTAAQNQSILTQEARAKAELSRKQAEINKAIADEAYKQQMGMSISDYLELRQLEIEKEKVELIKDKQNVSIIFGDVKPVKTIK